MLPSCDLQQLFEQLQLGTSDRAIRLQWQRREQPVGGLLLPQRITLSEGVCQGVTARISCFAPHARLPLADLIGQPFSLQLVTDQGHLRSVPLLLDQAQQGQSDGSLTAVQLVGRDVMTWMNRRRRLRTFPDRSVKDVVEDVFDEWRLSLAGVFSFEWLDVFNGELPRRACFVQQPDESDGAFVRRLLAGEGLAWAWRPQPQSHDGCAELPGQQLVIFKDGWSLPAADSGPVRYHRRDGTEPRDTIDLLSPQWRSVPRHVGVNSWNHESTRLDSGSLPTLKGQALGEPHPLLQDARLSPPHVADDAEHLRQLANRQADHHLFRSRALIGRGGVRTLAPATHLPIEGYPAFDGMSEDERDHIVVSVEHVAENNLPKELNGPAQALLGDGGVPDWARAEMQGLKGRQGYTNRFTAVPRSTPVVPLHPLAEVTPPRRLTGIVVGPERGEISCDELGRVRVRLIGGEPGADTTAWMRALLPWGGDNHGLVAPLRGGTEVLVDWMGPDRPYIAGVHYNGANKPPRPSRQPSLPENRNQTALVSREIGGTRQQHLLLDDTPGQLMAQLHSEAVHSSLSLGELTTPRHAGRAQPRGEGAELRTDGAAAARGAKGVLVSADGRRGAAGHWLDREEAIGRLQTADSTARHLGELAASNQADGTDTGPQHELLQAVAQWDAGTKGASADEAGLGGQPIVLLTAPAGIAAATDASATLSAGRNIDLVAVQHAQISAGKRFAVRAAESISLFAHRLGMKIVAAMGTLKLLALKGPIEMGASETVHIYSSSSGMVLEAPDGITLRSKGAEITLKDGRITFRANTETAVQAPHFKFNSGSAGADPNNGLAAVDAQHDQRLRLSDWVTGEPLANHRYRITMEDGQVIEGRTDANGLAQVLTSAIAFGRYTVEPLAD